MALFVAGPRYVRRIGIVNLPEHLKSKSVTELEEWFLEGLEQDPVPCADMLTVLREVRKAGATAQASSWAELLQDTLGERVI